MRWALVNSDNVVTNLIVYTPPTEANIILPDDPQAIIAAKKRTLFSPPEGLELRQVGDWIDIGDDADAPDPNG